MAKDRSASGDPFDLQRFVDAQERVYATALDELRAGRKRSHWIWFVFPQLRGLGRSPTAQRYGVGSLAEARAYLAHDVLGARLRECAELVARSDQPSADGLFGWPDNLKVRSSMTLFSRAAEDPDDGALFGRVLTKYYDGEPDQLTVELLSEER
ncbi:calpastatin [Mycolicibacterium acapulense]|nr:calpastatin [Mycolicibacterium acapulense]